MIIILYTVLNGHSFELLKENTKTITYVNKKENIAG